MRNHQVYLLYVLAVAAFIGCKVDNRIQTDILPSLPAEAPKVEVQNVYSGFSEVSSKGAPVFQFTGPANISGLKLYTDSQCQNEIASDFSYNGSNYLIRDIATQNKYRTGEFSYYVEYSYQTETYCQFLTKFTHDPVYIVSTIADESHYGIYMGVDNKGGVKVYTTSPLSGFTDRMIYEIEKTVKNPKKFGFVINALYILTQDNNVYIFSSSQFPTVPDYTDVKDLYFTTPFANSAALVKNDGTVAAFGVYATPPLGLTDVKELAVTRRGFIALKNSGEVISWGTTDLTGQVNPPNITGAVAIMPSNYGLYQTGLITLKSNGNVQYFGHGNRPGTPSGGRLTQVHGKSDIQFYQGFNSLALTYTDGGVTKGFAWTGGGRGGDSAVAGVDAQLVDIKKLVANNDSYVALLNNSSIVYWGFFGASNTMPTVGESTGVADVIPNDYVISDTVNQMQGHAFALIRQDGTVTAMGHNLYGGNMSTVAADVNQVGIGVKKVISTGRGFAALRNDGKVYVWGACGDQTKVSLLSGIDDIIASRSRYTSACGFLARSTDGQVYVVSHTDVKTNVELTGVHVKKILSADNLSLTYINSQNDIVKVGGGYTHLLNGVTQSFVDMGHEFYTNNAGSLYSVDGTSGACITTTLGLTVSAMTHFSSYLCLLNIYKINGVWGYSNDVTMAALNADFTAFVAVLNAQNIEKVWITSNYLFAIDVSGNLFYRPFNPADTAMASMDISVGVKDISYSASYVFVPSIVFHMKDNTVRYLGDTPVHQTFGGAISALTNINQIAVNVSSSLTFTEVIVKNNSNGLSLWSTEATPTYAFLSDYVDALATEDGTWVLKKNDGDYYYYNSPADLLLLIGPGTIVTNPANNIKHKSKRLFIKLANYKLAMVNRNTALQITYDPNDDGFESIYSADGTIFYAQYPNGIVRRLRVIESESY